MNIKTLLALWQLAGRKMAAIFENGRHLLKCISKKGLSSPILLLEMSIPMFLGMLIVFVTTKMQ